MDRFWISPAKWQAPFSLKDEEAHHCRRVMRKRVGDVIEIFDGQGSHAEARIIGLGSNEVQLELSGEVKRSDPGLQVELAVGIPKGKTFDLIIQKAVELGVSRIQPLMTEQGMVRIEAKDLEKKSLKWNRLALEASKQCGQDWLPEVLEPQCFSDWMKNRKPAEVELVGALKEGAVPLCKQLSIIENISSIRVLVGPEGDLSAEEYDLAKAEGFSFVSLGKLVLRVETAAFFVLSNLFGHFEGDVRML
jgi:16S rRNA (uracil1498-N3)-methyltransferase